MTDLPGHVVVASGWRRLGDVRPVVDARSATGNMASTCIEIVPAAALDRVGGRLLASLERVTHLSTVVALDARPVLWLGAFL